MNPPLPGLPGPPAPSAAGILQCERTGGWRQAGAWSYKGSVQPAQPDVIGVAELSRRLRRAVEGVTGRDWVEGEVAAVTRAASGHLYFSLKDEREDAVVDCVAYRTQALRLGALVIAGQRVQVLGKATLWAPRGRLQLVVERGRPAGRGALLEALERLKERLAAEGLFDPARKRPLPPHPRVVGVVTSASGAAFHDIRKVAFRRGRVRLVLSPATVQGEGAAESLVRALDRIERLPGLDVLIVGRGGGSAEDLMAFNDERVVRRLAAARVPVVSAVGHEIDTTLADLAADVRAATPSQAAELVVPDQRADEDRLARAGRALVAAMRARLAEDRHTLGSLQRRLGDPRYQLALRQQTLDDLTHRLGAQLQARLGREQRRLERLRGALGARHPRQVLAASRGVLLPLEVRLQGAMRGQLREAEARVGTLSAGLHALSPLSVLGRGYAIAFAHGRVVRSPDEVSPGERLSVRVERGTLEAVVAPPGGGPE